MPNALVIGSSDGIGLALVRRLLARGWTVTGISRSPLSSERLAAPPKIADVADTADIESRYRHIVIDVRDSQYTIDLARIIDEMGAVDACIYCPGIGQALDLEHIDHERAVFETNLMGAVTTVEVMLPRMLAAGRGHIVGLSSQADALRDPGAPSYSASKAGLSAYLEALALAVRGRGVYITNVRLGFVDTKMARAPYRPFLMSADAAAALVLRCLERRPVRLTRPRRMAVLLWLVTWPMRLRTWLT